MATECEENNSSSQKSQHIKIYDDSKETLKNALLVEGIAKCKIDDNSGSSSSNKEQKEYLFNKNDDKGGEHNDDDDDDDESRWTLYRASDHDTKFDAEQYLNGFYRTANEDFAMQTVLFFLPGIIYYRIPQQIRTLLDLGAGPTIYVPIIFRKRAQHIYTSDYAQINRDLLRMWIEERCSFDWINICEHIASIEEYNNSQTSSSNDMQQETRLKMRAILNVDVHKEKVIQGIHYNNSSYPIPQQFQVVVSNFCLEYASETYDDYRRAVRGAISLIEPGGYLVQGGVLNAKEYSFGRRRFKCHTLTKEQLKGTLKENGMEVENGSNFKLIIHDDIFILISKKSE